MKCAVVLIVNDFEALNEAYGLDYAFRSLADCGLSEPFHVLIAEGFDRIPAAFVDHWRAEGILISDCSATVASLFADHPWLSAISANPVYKVTLLRHLILQRHFGGEPVLSVDADIVWRTDPYRLFGHWRGGDFTVDRNGFLVFVRTPEWFDDYRAGLHSVLTGGALTADFAEAKFGITEVLHDQHLIGHLKAKGLIGDAWEDCWSTPELAGLCIMANPLHPKSGLRQAPERLTFSRDGDGDAIGGARIPFWHMQSSFSALCAFFFLSGEDGGRLPFPRPKAGKDGARALELHKLRSRIIVGKAPDEAMARLRPLMLRRGIYQAFFEGDLPARLFTDKVWWRKRVFA